MLRAKYGMMSSLELLFTRCAISEEWWWVISSPLCTMGDVQPSSSWSRKMWCWKELMQPGVRPFPRRLFSDVNRTSKASLYPPAPAHRLLASLNGPFTMNGSPRKQLLVLRILTPSVTWNLIIFYLLPTAVSKCRHGAFRMGLIIFRPYDGLVLYRINLCGQIFAEHCAAVGQQKTALSASPIKKHSYFNDTYIFCDLAVSGYC